VSRSKSGDIGVTVCAYICEYVFLCVCVWVCESVFECE
jgi:hypothetical protein